ncbi:oligosaccharide flippase family protein [Patescibacteria group bacterium]|nr:oligosaccharide flippase family protein [Patescibacteria group bacterium]
MIGKNVLIQLILTACSSVVGFIGLSISARLFGPFILGHLAYILGITGLIFAFSDLGLSRAQVHFTAAFHSAQKTLGTFLSLKFILLLATAGIAFLVALINPAQFKGIFIIILLYELLSRLAESILVTFEGLQLSWPQNLARFIAKLFRLLAILLIGYKLTSVLGLSLVYLVEATVLILLSVWLMRRFLPFNFSRSLAKQYFKYSLPFFVIVPVTYLQANLLTVLLKHFHSANEVGFYSAAFNLSTYLKVLFGTVMVFFFPKLSSLFQKNDLSGIKNYLNLTLKYLLMIFTPLLMFSFLLRQEIILLVLGQDFLPAVPVFSWMLLAVFVLLLINPYEYALYATKKHASLVKVNLISLALSLLLSVYLMSYWHLGAIGAAIINLIIWSFSGLYSLFLIKKNFGFSFYSSALHFILPAAILVFISSLIIYYYPVNLALKLVLSLISVFIYLFYLYLSKLIKLKDIKYFINLLKAK